MHDEVEEELVACLAQCRIHSSNADRHGDEFAFRNEQLCTRVEPKQVREEHVESKDRWVVGAVEPQAKHCDA